MTLLASSHHSHPSGHALNIEYYEGSGGAGIRFRWQGPDSSGTKEIVPTSAFQTPPPSTSICLSCGSPGEVSLSGFRAGFWAFWACTT